MLNKINNNVTNTYQNMNIEITLLYGKIISLPPLFCYIYIYNDYKILTYSLRNVCY